MPNGITPIELSPNEPIRGYAPGSPERASLTYAAGELLPAELKSRIGELRSRTLGCSPVERPSWR